MTGSLDRLELEGPVSDRTAIQVASVSLAILITASNVPGAQESDDQDELLHVAPYSFNLAVDITAFFRPCSF